MKMTATRPLTIRKDQHKASIYLNAYRITGTVHLQVGGRVSDFVNWNVSDGPFIPLTNVTVYSIDTDEQLFKTEFLAVHRNQINFLTLDKQDSEAHPKR